MNSRLCGVSHELQTVRTQDLSFARTRGPHAELSFPGPFVPGFPGTIVPGTFRSREFSFPYLRALFYNSSLGVV